MRSSRLMLAAMVALAATGCEKRRADDAPVAVSVIGDGLALRDSARGPLSEPARMLTAGVAQGLVRFDAAGGIEPGLAERWTVIDGGRSYIFRLAPATWADGEPVAAGQVVASLRQTIGARSHTPLAPFLEVIDEIVEMTPRVIEVRLAQPRPDLLKLFAQPEMAVIRLHKRVGTGPYLAGSAASGWLPLRRVRDPVQIDDEAVEPDPSDARLLRAERAASAILRFAARESDLVAGGSFRDWPLVARVDLPPASLRIDPAAGLFGLAVVSRDGFLGNAENRRALAMAIDRPALTALFRPEWTPVETLLPARLDSASDPVAPDWQALNLDQRRLLARSRLTLWRSGNPAGSLAVRIALPSGPGGSLIWAAVGRDLRVIGLQPYRVGPDDDADLRLIDAVAPYDSGRWYLVTACRTCPDGLTAVLDAARAATSLPERASRIAAADRALTDEGVYIPIAQPLRWSLVATRLDGWQENSRAWHPLTHLRR